MDNTLVIIPARGNSKRVPYKNTARIHGYSLLDRAITRAEWAGFDRILVSSESDDILEYAVKISSNVIPWKRKPELSNDDVQVDKVVLEVVAAVGRGTFEDAIVLQPTSPFLKPEQLREAFDLYTLSMPRIPVFSCYAISTGGYPYSSSGRGLVKAINHDPTHRVGKQWDTDPDSRDILVEDGGLYIASFQHILETGTFRSVEMVPYVVDMAYMGIPLASTEIDTMEQLDNAREWPIKHDWITKQEK